MTIKMAFKKKIKTCNVCRKDRYIYARGMCGQCYANHQAKKPRKKKVYAPKFRYYKRKATGELAFFKAISSVRGYKSQLSGKPINPNDPSCYAHILNKGRYPEYRLSDRNIYLLTPEEHTLLDFGTEEEREAYAKANNCSWKELYDLKESLQVEAENK